MKRIILGTAIAIIVILTLSMSISGAKNDGRFGGNGGVTLTVPAKPTATVYVMGEDQMYVYLKKGYQVQQVVGDPTHSDRIRFLLTSLLFNG